MVTVVHLQTVVVVVVSSVTLEAEVVVIEGRAVVAFDEALVTVKDVGTPEVVLLTEVGAEEELKLDEVTLDETGMLEVGALELEVEFDETGAVTLAEEEGPLEGAAEELELTLAKPEVGSAELELLTLAEEVTETGTEVEELFLEGAEVAVTLAAVVVK